MDNYRGLVYGEDQVSDAKKDRANLNKLADAIDGKRKEKKREAILEQYRAMIGALAALAPYEWLHNPKWLNVSVGMGAICQELGGKIDRITAGLAAIDGLQLPPELARYEAAKAAQASQVPPVIPTAPRSVPAPEAPPASEEIFVVDFRIRATRTQLQDLKQAMSNLGIKPEKI